jgi:hypothetical protein
MDDQQRLKAGDQGLMQRFAKMPRNVVSRPSEARTVSTPWSSVSSTERSGYSSLTAWSTDQCAQCLRQSGRAASARRRQRLNTLGKGTLRAG